MERNSCHIIIDINVTMSQYWKIMTPGEMYTDFPFNDQCQWPLFKFLDFLFENEVLGYNGGISKT